MRRESLRRHGVLERVEGTGGVELFRDAKAEAEAESKAEGEGKKKPRTRVEGRLEGYKGRGKAVERFREERPEMSKVEGD